MLYIETLGAPNTVDTMPEETLNAFAEHGKVGPPMPRDGGDAEAVLSDFGKAGVDVVQLAATLQKEGAEAFVQSWNELMAVIETKCSALKKAS